MEIFMILAVTSSVTLVSDFNQTRSEKEKSHSCQVFYVLKTHSIRDA